MAFLNTLSQRGLSAPEAALAAGTATLHLDGELTALEKRIIALFRDQFSPLSLLDEPTFEALLQRGMSHALSGVTLANVGQWVNTTIAPVVTNPTHRLELYRYCYALAMADLNVDEGENAVLTALIAVFGLSNADTSAAEAAVLTEFAGLHRALAATVVGLLVVTADGKVGEDELANIRNARTLLEPIGRLDDVQFELVFDLSLNIHDRFLLEPANREAFLTNVVTHMLNTPELARQAFEYAASVATSDGDIATSEADTLKAMLAALHVPDAEGEAIFNRYMAHIRTVDGRPI